MPSFVYNPYSSTPPSVESALRNLTRGGPPALALVQSIQEQIVQKELEWSLELAQALSSYVLQILDPSKDDIPDGSTAALHLLTTAMEQWQDDVLYAVLVHSQQQQQQQDSKNLLELLKTLTIKDHPVHRTALAGLAISCRALDRLQQLTSLDSNQTDTAWWILERDAKKWASLALRSLDSGIVHNSQGSRQNYPCSEQIKLAATSILATLLKHDWNDWLAEMSEEHLRLFCQHRLSDAQSLINPELPPSSSSYTLPCALLSASLLSLIQWKHNLNLSELDRTIHTTSLVENVFQFAFPSQHVASQSRGPRWTRDDQNETSRPYALDLIYCWSLCGGEAWLVFGRQENQWGPFAQGFWTDMMSNRPRELERTLPGIFLLHTSCRLAMRGMLFSAIQRHMGTGHDMTKSCQMILSSLFQLFRHSSFKVKILATRLFWVLLSDRKSPSTHDDVSRAIWCALDETVLEDCMTTTLEYASTEDIQQPLLLALLDLLDVQLQMAKSSDFILSKLGAHSVESLIYLVKPKEVRIDFMDASDTMETEIHELDSDTPPANNLSRMDEKSICVEQEEEKEARGMDNTVRLAAAIALSRLGYCSSMPTDEGTGLLISRICTAVNDFVVCYHHLYASTEDECILSLDTSKRSFRLQLSVTTPENEDFVSTMIFTTQVLEQRKLSQLREENKNTQKKLDASLEREKRLQKEKNKYVQQCRSQSTVFQREMSRMKKATTQDARQLVAIHASERSNAEQRVSKFARQLEQAESRIEEAINQAEESQRAQVLTREELQIALSKVVDLRNNNEEFRRQVNEEEAKSNELAEEIYSKTEELESLDRRHHELEAEIHLRDETISDVEGTNGKLQQDLEDLFADMVSLTQIYQCKESEEAANKEKNNKSLKAIDGKLKLERQSNEEMTENMEGLRRENEKLYKKLAKYKERLEEERRERQEESHRRKRNGPVSYINQLHQSSISDKSVRDKSSRKEGASEKSVRDRSRMDKENSYYYAKSSSQRGKQN